MATVEPKSLYTVSPAEPENAYFTVAINTTGFLDTETVNGGRVSPCVAATTSLQQPTTIAQSLLSFKRSLRFKMMMEQLGIENKLQDHQHSYNLCVMQVIIQSQH